MGYFKRDHKAPPFVMIRKDMLKDPEWLKLSVYSKILWLYLRAKFNLKNGDNIGYTYIEAKKVHGWGPATHNRAIKQLIKEKWIKKTKHGGLIGGGWCEYKFIGKYADFYTKQRV